MFSVWFIVLLLMFFSNTKKKYIKIYIQFSLGYFVYCPVIYTSSIKKGFFIAFITLWDLRGIESSSSFMRFEIFFRRCRGSSGGSPGKRGRGRSGCLRTGPFLSRQHDRCKTGCYLMRKIPPILFFFRCIWNVILGDCLRRVSRNYVFPELRFTAFPTFLHRPFSGPVCSSANTLLPSREV